MGKLLRVLVVFFLLFAIASLVLGILLFDKRELLKGRTQKLEDTLIALSPFIEDQPPRLDDKPEYVSRDASDCTSTVLDDPERSDFWRTYRHELEVQGSDTMNVGEHKIQLMTYYLRNPITDEIERDAATKRRITEGKGTMQELLDEVLSKTERQLNTMSETRQQLTDLREEYIETINELNERKHTLRDRLSHIVSLNQKIDELEDTIRQLQAKIEELEDEKRALQDTIAEQQETIAKQQEDIAKLQADIETLEKTIERMQDTVSDVMTTDGGIGTFITPKYGPGVKGSVVDVDEEWKFVVMSLRDDFLEEILPDEDDREGRIPPLELFIKRPGKGGKVVTKVRLIRIDAEKKLGVADILSDWQQLPVEKGDLVFH